MSNEARKGARGRKVVQVATAPGAARDNDTLIVALCDDGSVWQRWAVGNESNEWRQLPAIPRGAGR